MAVFSGGRLGLALAAALSLSACDDAQLGNIFAGNGSTDSEDAPDAAPAPGTTQIVEAPDLFDVSDTGLWDGRPSLGLIWVAYEGADPTNVIIRNEENGQFVVGALYRRERFFPGPPFQLSSDAAAELGILAGRPTRIRVTALREETVPEPDPVEDQVEEAPADIAAVAPAEDEPAEADISIQADAPAEPVGDAGASIAAAAAAAIDAADPEPVEVTAEPVTPPRRPTVEGPNAPLPRRIPSDGVAAPASIEPMPVAVGEPVTNPIQPPRAAVSSLERPFIQVGIFSVQENAEQTAQGLANAGVIAFIEEQRVGGRLFYRVVVGPATDAAERAELLRTVEGQGFTDAYFVRN